MFDYMAFSVGAVTAKLEAKIGNFTRQFDRAADTVEDFGKVSDRTKNTLRNMQNRLEGLQSRLAIARKRQSQFNAETSELTRMRVAESIRKTETAIDILGDRMKQTAQDGRGMYDRLDAIEGQMGRVKMGAMALASTIGNIVAEAFWRAVDAAKEYVSTLIMAAAETEKQAIAFEVLTGSTEKSAQLMRQINDLAVATPFDIAQLRDITKQMLAFGFSQEEVIPLTKMLGDITAGTGGDLTLLGRAIGQVRTKGKLYAQELNQLGEQGLAVREVLANQLNVSVAELMKGMEAGTITVTWEQFRKTLEGIHKDKFMDLMARQSQTLAGRIQNVQEQLSLVGQEILGINTETGEIIPGSVIDKATNGLKNIIDFLEQNKEAIVGFGQAAFNALSKGFSFVIDNGQLIIAAFGGIAAALVAFKISAVAASIAAAGGLSAVAAAAWAAMSPLLPFVAIAAAVAAAIYGIWQAWNSNFLGFRDGIMFIYNQGIVPLYNFLVSAFTPAWNELTVAFQNLWVSIQPLVQALWSQLQPALMSIWNVISPQLIPILVGLSAVILGPVIVAIGALVATIYGAIKVLTFLANTTTSAVNWMRSNWNSLSQAVTTSFNVQASGIRMFMGVIGGLVGRVQSAVGGVRAAFNVLRSINLYQIGVSIVQGLVNGIGSMVGAVQAKASEIAAGVKNTISSALEIGSPSKLMEQFGKWTGEGLAIGMNQSQLGVASASANMASAAVAPVSNTTSTVNDNKTINVSGMAASELEKFINNISVKKTNQIRSGGNRAFA
jgi:tape measure domain-containing protein